MAWTSKYRKLWLEKNKDKVRLYAQAYYKKNKKKLNNYTKKWKKENRDKVRDAQQEWYYSDAGKAYLERMKGLRREQYLKRWSENPEKRIKATRKWYYSKAGRKYMAEYREKNRERRREHNRKWNDNNKHKTRTYYLVYKALNDGSISKLPCDKCGSRKDLRAAHNDYSNPLDITWLCRKHHAERQRHVPTKKEIAKVLKGEK